MSLAFTDDIGVAALSYPVKPVRAPFSVEDLKQVRLLQDLPLDALLYIYDVGRWLALKPNEACAPTQNGAVCFALSGLYRVSIMSPSGHHVTIRTVRSGDHFGEISAFSRLKPSEYNVIVDATGYLLQLSRSAFCHLLDEYPQLVRTLLAAMADIAVMRSELIYEFATLNTKLRLVAELLRLGAVHTQFNDRILIRPAPTHEAIATQIGATREGITRHIKTLAQQGLISAKRGEIAILDVERMRRLVERASGRHAAYMSH